MNSFVTATNTIVSFVLTKILSTRITSASSKMTIERILKNVPSLARLATLPCSQTCKVWLDILSLNATVPKDLCFVFLIDVSKNSADSQLLFYAVSAIKKVMAREQFNGYVVLLYTYDTNLHCYSFENGSVSRTIVDRNVDEIPNPIPCDFSTIRVENRTNLGFLLRSVG